ncbi:MAG: hypothetical protein KGI29_07365 [Pseudomonadota bacterium]|nr:hypothetical protein [Pseudomonadota bacterium]
MTGGGEEEQYIMEFISMGPSLKVTAFDPATLREVSIVGDPRASREELSQLAIRKLRYVLNRDKDN